MQSDDTFPAQGVVSYLYVEDNDDLRDLLVAFIGNARRSVTAVRDAETALELMASRRYDVLMTDVSLPGMSGTELARRWVAAQPAGWVVLCTGYELSQGLEHLGRNVRAILKSADPEELDALLREVDACIMRAA